MVKVIIADDEERICQLLYALVDWKGLGLELAGIAHNGLEALELIDSVAPDILITDIRMPGCSGLELIGRVKRMKNNLEVIIISGYAHFEYAQQAIQYGVGDYLLKPVNREELSATLKKLKKRVCERLQTEQDREKLLKKAEEDELLLQDKLINDLMSRKKQCLSLEELQNTYRLDVKPGIFQAFWMKMDCGQEEFSHSSVSLLMDKSKEMLELGLSGKCTSLILGIRDFSCVGFLNYEKENTEKIRRALKNCVNQLELQKSLFHPVRFSIALGRAVTEPEELGESMEDAYVLIQERIVKGTGRLFERLAASSGITHNGLLEQYMREMFQGVDMMNVEGLKNAVELLEKGVRQQKEVQGREVLELVSSAADVFAVKMQIPDKEAFVSQFRQKSSRCGNMEEIFQSLYEMEEKKLQEMCRQRENDTVRPIRKAKQYIQEHYSEPITQEEVSSSVGLSPAYFSALFKKTEGEGFAKYLINVRMEQAKVLLRETNLSIGEICQKVGYNDLKHFTHTFEKAAGVKPAVYRKLYG